MNDVAKWIFIGIALVASAIYFWTDAQANRKVKHSMLFTAIAALLALAFFWLIWPVGFIWF